MGDKGEELLDVNEADDVESSSVIGGTAEDELGLPRATVTKMIQELLPPGVTCPKETRDLLMDCCVEFIHLVSSEANEACERHSRKTISPEHVLEALDRLGFAGYVPEVQTSWDDAQDHAKKEKERRESSSNKLERTGLTEEELIRQQQALFENSRRRFLENQQNAAHRQDDPVVMAGEGPQPSASPAPSQSQSSCESIQLDD